MSSNSDDIHAVSSDTRPPMLDMTDYESWNTLGTTPEGGVLLGPERPCTYDDLSDNEKKRYDVDIRATNIVLQGLWEIGLSKTKDPTSGIRAEYRTLNKKNLLDHKANTTLTILYKMSQPANDEFSQHLSDDEASNHKDASDTGATPKQQQQVIPQTTAISNIKLPILKKEEYDIWAMEMEHYLEYIDNDVWKKFKLLTRKGKAKNNMLKDHVEAIRTRFGVLEAHGAEVSTEDANHKFLRSLPPAWSNLAMTMRTKPDVDTLIYCDRFCTITLESLAGNHKLCLKNHLFKCSKFCFCFTKQKHQPIRLSPGLVTVCLQCCTPSTSSTNIPEKEVLAGFADEVIYSLFAKQSEDWDLLHES
ncbi:hypothetical protein Tco_0704826 [Tanacetum coccineum]|uniref:Uncharacterized protein n=1 Tax=Tanacetum coccineum TaxID=301880 RepID=A0ABQ4Y2T6_9ASTR